MIKSKGLESGGTGFPACADKGLNLKDIPLILFHKEHLGKMRVINAARLNTFAPTEACTRQIIYKCLNWFSINSIFVIARFVPGCLMIVTAEGSVIIREFMPR
jgi:hypothetical protein